MSSKYHGTKLEMEFEQYRKRRKKQKTKQEKALT